MARKSSMSRADFRASGIRIPNDSFGIRIIGRVVAQGCDPFGEAGLKQVGFKPIDHVVERVVSRQTSLIGGGSAAESRCRDPARLTARFRRSPPCRKAWCKAPATISPAKDKGAPAGAGERVRQSGDMIKQHCGSRQKWRHGLRIIEVLHESYFGIIFRNHISLFPGAPSDKRQMPRAAPKPALPLVSIESRCARGLALSPCIERRYSRRTTHTGGARLSCLEPLRRSMSRSHRAERLATVSGPSAC